MFSLRIKFLSIHHVSRSISPSCLHFICFHIMIFSPLHAHLPLITTTYPYLNPMPSPSQPSSSPSPPPIPHSQSQSPRLKNHKKQSRPITPLSVPSHSLHFSLNAHHRIYWPPLSASLPSHWDSARPVCRDIKPRPVLFNAFSAGLTSD